MTALETKRTCPNCGHELHARAYLMAVDPEAPGLLKLWRAWFAGERSLLAFLAVVGPCVLIALLVAAVVG